MERVEMHERQQDAHSNLHSNGAVVGLKRFCFLAGPRQQLSSLQCRSVKSFELRSTLNKPDLKCRVVSRSHFGLQMTFCLALELLCRLRHGYFPYSIHQPHSRGRYICDAETAMDLMGVMSH